MSLQSLPPVTDAYVAALKARLGSPETQWVERKESYDQREVRRTLVAFANSVRDGESAVLFIGAADKGGKHPGVKNVDEIQRWVWESAQNYCYPPIPLRLVPILTEVNGKIVTIMAVEIPANRDRPHFAAPAYVRIGSTTMAASANQFEELIASRNDIVRKLQQVTRGVIVRVRATRGLWFEFKGALERAKLGEALKIDVYDSGGASIYVPLGDVEIISTDGIKPVLQIPPVGTEKAHIMDMLNHWRKYQHNAELFIDPKNEIIKQLIHFAPEVCIYMAQEGWADNQRDRPVFDFFSKHDLRFRQYVCPPSQ